MARFKTHLSIILIVAFAFAGWGQTLHSNDSSTIETRVTPLNRNLTLGALALETVALIGLNELWYVDYPRRSFHFYNDNSTWQGMDKWGHAYSTYELARILNEVFSAPSVHSQRPLLKSALFSASFVTAIEVLDGFSAEWGFSWGDMTANAAGLSLFVLQEMFLDEPALTLKFSYRPSKYAEIRPEVLGGTFVEQLFKDYNGQQYWLTLNGTGHSSSRGDGGFWQLIRPSIGFGAGGMLAGSPDHPIYNQYPSIVPHRRVMLSLDVNWSAIRARRPWAKAVITVLNAIKMPAPAMVWMPSSGTVQIAPLYF